MKKAFTLIELLVVIAIIAILAAILFPVFAQAKESAKGATSVSNQKQIGLSVMMYMGDNDDMFPRQDGCQAGSSLNPALNSSFPFPANGVGPGCTTSPFVYRMNHFSWQKWVMPYMKSVAIFQHPHRGISNRNTPSCPTGEWTGCGQLTASYAINLSLTGALNTYGTAEGSNNRFRDSFLGGSQSALPQPSATMLLMETGNQNIAFAPTAVINGATGERQINYAPAVRELWLREFTKSTNNCGPTNDAAFTSSGQVDTVRAPRGGIVVGFADGSVRFMPVGRFLGLTPTAAEYGATSITGQGSCMFPGGTFRVGSVPNTAINYPFWGLGS